MKIKLSKDAYIPEGYGFTVSHHEEMESFDPKDISLHIEPEQEKDYIKGEILEERMKGKGFNSTVLKYLLDHPKFIPEEWKSKYVYFWGTVLRSSLGYRYVLCLCWRGGEWLWNARWLGDGWSADVPSAVLASKSSVPSPSVLSDPLSLELPNELTINGILYIKK